MTPPSHDEIAELLGAYALDAVDPDEAAAVEDHLVNCPRCRDEVARHREVAASLAFAGTDAPEGLWERIVSGLDTGPSAPELAHLYPLRPTSRSVSMRVVSFVGAVAAGLILVLAFQIHAQGRDLKHVKNALPAKGLDAAVQGALLDPSADKVHLQSNDGRVYIDAVLLKDGTGYLVGNDLPALASDRTYQLWGQVGDHNVSLGVLGGHPTIVPFRAVAPIRALAVTDERSGGVVASQQPAVVVGFVPPGAVPSSTA
jgi:Anti-sigma-K factor rskA/Putative zinc-finger